MPSPAPVRRPSAYFGAARFLASVLLLAGLLRLLGYLPELLDSGTLRRFGSLQSARGGLGSSTLLPSYFPEHLAWPATEVLGGRRPHVTLVLHFADRGTGELDLALSQGEPGAILLPTRLEPARVLATEELELRGTVALVETAVCADGRPCNRVRGSVDGRPFELVSRGPLDELVRVARTLAIRAR